MNGRRLEAVHRIAVAALDQQHEPGGMSVREAREALLKIARLTDHPDYRDPLPRDDLALTTGLEEWLGGRP